MITLSEKTERLALLVASKSGKTPDEVLLEALEERARFLGISAQTRSRPIDMARVETITRRNVSRPLRDMRSPREILDEAWGDPA